ncbi:MAG: 50S ribosomal protein L4 [Candidatus Nealsonbacteria bacterium]
MKIDTYDQTGKNVGQTLLPKEIFDLKINRDLIHSVMISQTINRRRSTAQAKDRSQVRGGGKKPWRQKGTGRARHGSIRSPLWRGGGVTFGPTTGKVFNQKINKKMKRKAAFMVLSAKAKDNLIVLVDKLKLESPKTKLLSQILKKLPSGEKSVLMILPDMEKSLIRAARNMDKVGTLQAREINTLDLLKFKYIVLLKDSIKVMKETFK